MVEGLKDALKEDNEQKKELSYLRRLDCQDNVIRSKNFYNMYRNKLIEKIEDKIERVNKLQQSKLNAKMIYED
eukprot:CAMPEP_0170542956 /NCGR_PEP_ID=MMETSP0211-20121228/2230_1 /TAXON_ID=311385 /ORGANISM="Pseudokeronopsis sp., Strain OXSARD2" /LENGTH=72 /DNA_ID=CAMNT_0010846199 /DNA_START=1285 /DNA_END=1503 /DNA_ORIENTATION=-